MEKQKPQGSYIQQLWKATPEPVQEFITVGAIACATLTGVTIYTLYHSSQFNNKYPISARKFEVQYQLPAEPRGRRYPEYREESTDETGLAKLLEDQKSGSVMNVTVKGSK